LNTFLRGLGGRSGNSKFVNRAKKEKLLQWCGHIERMDTKRIIRKTVTVKCEHSRIRRIIQNRLIHPGGGGGNGKELKMKVKIVRRRSDWRLLVHPAHIKQTRY
jgi:hypothetical protein